MSKLQRYAAIISITAGTLAIGGFIYDRFLAGNLPDLSGDEKIPQAARACLKAARQTANQPSLRYFAKGDDNWEKGDRLTTQVKACIQSGPLARGNKRMRAAARAYEITMQAVHLRITKPDGGQIKHTESDEGLAKHNEKCRDALKASYRLLASCVQAQYKEKKKGRCTPAQYDKVKGYKECDILSGAWPKF